MNDPTFSWIQFGADLAVAIIGSFIAILGALWVANRTFRRDIEEQRRRSFIALVIEFNGNMESIGYMLNDPAIMFPLECRVLDQAIVHLEVVPPHVGAMVQDAAIVITRFNASDPLSVEALKAVRTPLHNALVALARFLKGDTSLPSEWVQWASEKAEA
jgi:hypothetical protein